ncbi:MAG TPA: hypothetical protein VFL95_02635 [Gemmatimonadales bacterium]|nr:hypothetical protein [Gemmatimonadales bacterium]
MADERNEVTGAVLARWIGIAAIILIGIGLSIWLAPKAVPLAPVAGHEAAP